MITEGKISFSFKKTGTLMCCTFFLCSCSPEENRKTTDIGPGIKYTRIHQNQVPNVIHVVECDRNNPKIEVFSAKAGNNLRAVAPLSQLVNQESKNSDVIAAINGDFFSQEGIPSGAQAVRGAVVKDAPEAWLALGVTDRRTFFIDRVHFTGILSASSFSHVIIDGFNRVRQTEEVIAYNSFYGTHTNTNEYGTEVILKVNFAGVYLGDTLTASVLEMDSSKGDHDITDSTIVISAHGLKANYLKTLHAGQRVRVLFHADPAHGRILSLIGGFPLLVKDGKNCVSTAEISEFYNKKFSRTAVGTAGPSLFLVCVDGSQPNYSVGMTLFELADFMTSLGCESALNLDGGGSTTMMIQNRTVNRPSDGQERNISSALMIGRRE
jgi:hypothetical protein